MRFDMRVLSKWLMRSRALKSVDSSRSNSSWCKPEKKNWSAKTLAEGTSLSMEPLPVMARSSWSSRATVAANCEALMRFSRKSSTSAMHHHAVLSASLGNLRQTASTVS